MGFVGGAESCHAFCIHDEGILDDQVGDEVADEAGFVVCFVFGLLFEMDASVGEFEAESPFVELLVEAGSEGLVYFDGGGDYGSG